LSSPVIIRYFFNGCFIFGVNLALVYFIYKIPATTASSFSKNITNILIIEIVLLISFPIHNFHTWKDGSENLLKKLIKFHLVAVSGTILRLIAFWIIDKMGAHVYVSSVGSMLVVVIHNFLGYSFYVFKNKTFKKVPLDEA